MGWAWPAVRVVFAAIGAIAVVATGVLLALLPARGQPQSMPAPTVVVFKPTERPTTAPTATSMPPTATSTPTAPPTATPTAPPTATPAPVVVDGRVYEAYIEAATKPAQVYKYSCEFDAAWVVLRTFGLDVSVDDMIDVIGVDERVEPYIEERNGQFVIHGGDITTRFSGSYRNNVLARSTGAAMRNVFEQYGLSATPVHDRAGVEAALRSGSLVWMKTTVDFKPWRPALWLTPEGRTLRTVLGNDHAVVVIGFNADGVAIRDVLGPTSSNWQRPYEYHVAWETFLRSWSAQDFDGLAVGPQRTR
ncbi:MAG TPA: C39 family peptidase [Roseiflexaceae bacterium]|nr:C39 family peptidase [Roseiflexaceae bacterium]